MTRQESPGNEAPKIARQSGLRYVGDNTPGISRIPANSGFRYVDADGNTIRDEETLARIRSLAIPPAWTDVWICPWENGHLQATGRDARRRKQYRYHHRWRNVRDEVKYERMVGFGKALPAIREQVEAALKLPGQELFQYVDDGQQRTVGSADVNDYLRSLTGEDYAAKDFRTWSGTLLAALALQEYEKFDSEAQAKKNIVRAIESVAERLGNTPSICRKCYVHPAVIESYLDGTMLQALRSSAREELLKDLHALSPEEAAVLALLQERLETATPTVRKAGRKRARKVH